MLLIVCYKKRHTTISYFCTGYVDLFLLIEPKITAILDKSKLPILVWMDSNIKYSIQNHT